ncbi:hypothetical protein K1719_024245 [Acacia pycnantha]|nr:hypothetical protein K1719_024245 [Acacia pycnantha]
MDELPKRQANFTQLTPLTFLYRAASSYPNRISIVHESTSFTWPQTYDRCRRLASSLRSLNVSKHDVISVLAPNIPATYEMHFAVPMAGAVLNTINTRLDANNIATILRHSEAKVLFVDYEYVSKARDALRLLMSTHHHPNQHSSLPFVVVVVIDDTNSPTGIRLGELEYEQMVHNGDPNYIPEEIQDEWDPIALNYTSGTTSAPKGVVYSHRGAYLSTLSLILAWEMGSEPVYLWTLPIILLEGKPVVAMKSPVKILTGGAPPPPALLERIESLGFLVTHGYGLTEATGPALICEWQKNWDRLEKRQQSGLKARQGISILTMADVDVKEKTTMKSVTRDGKSMGEIVLRGSGIMKGYYKDSENSSKAFENGWFWTGDVGVIHPDGYVEIKDRSKDVIISGGENISSVEVESVLYTHPAVAEAAVVAMPHPRWGESPCAFVALKKKKNLEVVVVEEGEIVAYCRKKLPSFMVPKVVRFMEELPKTSTGKIQKYELREKAKEFIASSSEMIKDGSKSKLNRSNIGGSNRRILAQSRL